MLSTEFNSEFLKARSFSSHLIKDVYQGTFDLLIVTSSWDKRCISITESDDISAKYGVVLLFSDRDDLGLRDKHDPILREFVSQNCSSYFEIEGDSEDLKTIWDNISHLLAKAFEELGKPLNVFVDLSTCPRYYSLGVLTFGITTGLVGQITYGYSEGKYPEESEEMDRHEMFTKGGWNAVPIPSVEGEWETDKGLTYLVSVGFEGSKTHRLVSRAEPDNVCVLFPDPPVVSGYVERTLHNNRAFFEHFNVKEEDLILAQAGDAIAAWANVSSAIQERGLEENCFAICCGTKPHSLGLALSTIATPGIALLYIVPDRHLVVDVSASGVYWRYEIRDASAIF